MSCWASSNLRFGALAHELGCDLSKPQLLVSLSLLDKNGDGTIDFEEFLAWWQSKPLAEALGQPALPF
eukprot:SAG11_NODE_640_length_8012_cov_14.412486_9_plen_68_part_00